MNESACGQQSKQAITLCAGVWLQMDLNHVEVSHYKGDVALRFTAH